MSDAPLLECPECKQPALRRLIGTGAGLIFKGSGFYETDFKDRKGNAKSEKSDGDNKQESSAAKSAEVTAPSKESGSEGKTSSTVTPAPKTAAAS